MESTLKEDIKAALVKERNRLNALDRPTQEEEDRLSICIEFVTRINRGEAELNVTIPWQGPIRL